MNGGIKWSDESTREFIQLRYKLRHLFNGRKHQCEKAYSRIVDELGLRNIISPTQARKKWSNLLQKYMDIKGGYSTANQDWPYFQILDQIVPLMRKEKIEKLSTSSVDSKELESSESLPSPLTSTPADPESLSMPGVQAATGDAEKCKTEVMESGEPPRKRGRGRRAAQRARDRWWGAVEDSELGSECVVGGGVTRGEVPPHHSTTAHPSKAVCVDGMGEASQMELQTLTLLETCSTALTDIRGILKGHTERQESLMKTLQQAVTHQSRGVKDMLNTISSQNATLITLLTQMADNNKQQQQQQCLGINTGANFTPEKIGREQTSHNEEGGQLLASQHSLIVSALTQPNQECENSLVATPGLTDTINSL